MLYVILKKKTTKGINNLQETATKPLSLFNAYELFKSPYSVDSLNFTSNQHTMFWIVGLTFKLKFKL